MQIAILSFGDLVEVMRHHMLQHLDTGGTQKPNDSALCQLLLKAVSNDKKFVLEAARKVLRTCAACLELQTMLEHALPYTQHKCDFQASVQPCVLSCLNLIPSMPVDVWLLATHLAWQAGKATSWIVTEAGGCRNPKVRGVVAETLLDTLQQADSCPDEDLLVRILQRAVPLLSDNTPQARANSRNIVCKLRVWGSTSHLFHVRMYV